MDPKTYLNGNAAAATKPQAAEFQMPRAHSHHMFCPVGALLHTCRRKQVIGARDALDNKIRRNKKGKKEKWET